MRRGVPFVLVCLALISLPFCIVGTQFFEIFGVVLFWRLIVFWRAVMVWAVGTAIVAMFVSVGFCHFACGTKVGFLKRVGVRLKGKARGARWVGTKLVDLGLEAFHGGERVVHAAAGG